MTTPFNPGTWYKFVNVKYGGQALDLLDAVPNGPIGGYQLNNDSRNQSWLPTLSGSAGIYDFKNGSVQTSYVYVGQQVQGAGLTGGSALSWRLIPVEGSPGVYRLGILDASLVWGLTGGANYNTVELVDVHTSGDEANWTIIVDPQQ